jgi:hypothetical protein
VARLPWTKDKFPCAAKLVEIVNARRAAMQEHAELEIILPLKKASKLIKK